MKKFEIRLTGSGGQGLITCGIILAEAAILDGKNALQSQSYGPEARGGASKAEVIISDNEIVYPKITECDLLLSLTNEACNKYLKSLKKGGILVIDSTVERPERDDIIVYQIPIIQTANEELKKSMVANIVALGALNKILNLISEISLEKAVLERVPKGTEELNKKALIKGRNLIE